jgi:biotin synthase-like enzyme
MGHTTPLRAAVWGAGTLAFKAAGNTSRTAWPSFMAGANSIFTGDKLLTAANAGDDKDAAMLAKLGLVPMEAEEPLRACKALEPAE